MRVHLIDGTYELFRAHFSKRPEHHDRHGQPVKASYGLLSSMLALLHDEDEAPSHVAVAFDNPIRSFRNDLFAGYKTEAGVSPELLDQFDLAERVTAALGLQVWSMDRWEADDALATGAALAATDPRVEQVRIVSPDKDLGQCVRGSRVVQVDRVRKRVIDEAMVTEARVAPSSIPDFLALVGDDADGIPGIAGFGVTTSKRLLDHYGHLEQIPEDGAAWAVTVRGAAKLAQALAEHRDEVLLYRRLATLVDDVPLGSSLDDLRWAGVPRATFTEMCEQLDVPRLQTRPKIWA